ncbi:MAG: AEC family transporter [Chlamydiales bacterium]|nr:AEC family transporter [Chlamydiales bacterium]
MFSESYFSVLATAFSVFLITALGAVLRKKGKLTDQVDSTFLWLTINILYPCLIANSMLKNPALDSLENIIVAPLMGFSSFLIGLALSYLFYPMSGLTTDGEKKSFLFSNALYNWGFLPIPLILALYSRETLGVLFVHNIGVDIAVWSVGILIISSKMTLKESAKKLVNAPLCTIGACLFLTYFDLDEHVPKFVFSTTYLLGQAAIPVSMLLIGSLMYDTQKSSEVTYGVRVITLALLIRLALFPICYLGLVWALPLSLELKQVMLVEAAMPAAMLPIMLAKRYNASGQIAFIVVLVTSLASLITMPLWINLGTYLLS